jgi:hypothetical protein
MTIRSRLQLPCGLLCCSLWLALACSGPVGVFPGGELRGELVTEPPASWSFPESGVLTLETRAGDPYSVNIGYTTRDGVLYIDPAEERRWLAHLRDDPLVRVRIDGRIYPMRAESVGPPGSLAGFPEDRYVYRLLPR